MTDKLFIHGVCIARVTKTAVALFWNDKSRSVIQTIKDKVFLSLGRSSIVNMNGEIVNQDESEAATFAQRIKKLEGQRPTERDKEIFNACVSLLIKE